MPDSKYERVHIAALKCRPCKKRETLHMMKLTQEREVTPCIRTRTDAAYYLMPFS